MIRLISISVLSLLLAGGCIHTKCGDGGNDPIVSPTNISTEVQDTEDPVLPPYTPWWAQEGN